MRLLFLLLKGGRAGSRRCLLPARNRDSACFCEGRNGVRMLDSKCFEMTAGMEKGRENVIAERGN